MSRPGEQQQPQPASMQPRNTQRQRDSAVYDAKIKTHRQVLVVLAIGLLLSLIIMVPPLRLAGASDSFLTPFSIILHLLLFIALPSPFVVIYLMFRNSSSRSTPIALGVAFSLCHLWLIYATYAFPPQEFGYLGLIFAPFLEAVVAIPAALLVIFLIKPLRLN
jgi:hypothetical protein